MRITTGWVRVALAAAALALAAACYPLNPTPDVCQREHFPPACGCPTNIDPTGFYQPGTVYWPDNPEGFRGCGGSA